MSGEIAPILREVTSIMIFDKRLLQSSQKVIKQGDGLVEGEQGLCWRQRGVIPTKCLRQ
jgi:hypothetical protein